jgi:hypothetical protein
MQILVEIVYTFGNRKELKTMYKLICDVGASVSVDSLPPIGESDTLYRVTKPNAIETKHPILVESLYTYENGEFKYHCDRLIYTNTRADVLDSPVYYEEGMELNEDTLYMINKEYIDEETQETTKVIELDVAINGVLNFVNNVTQYPDDPSPEEVIVNNITAEVENDLATLTIDGLGFTDQTEVTWELNYDGSTSQSIGTGTTYQVDASAGSRWDSADTVSVSVTVGSYKSDSYTVKTASIAVNEIEALINGSLVTLIAEGKAIGESTNIDWHIKYEDAEPIVVSSTGTSLVLDEPNTTNFFQASDVDVFVTIEEYVSETFNVRHVVEISNIAAAEEGDNVTFTMSCRNIPADAEIGWVVYYDEGDGVAFNGTGYSVALDAENVEAYKAAATVKVQASYDNFTSELFTVKEAPAPEPISVDNITPTVDGETVSLELTGTGITDESLCEYTMICDDSDGVVFEGTGTTVTLDATNSASYIAATNVDVTVTIDDYTSEVFRVKNGENPVENPEENTEG